MLMQRRLKGNCESGCAHDDDRQNLLFVCGYQGDCDSKLRDELRQLVIVL